MNPLYGDIDPYWMALAGIDEAVRNLVCVGGRTDRIALLDNYCWGNCNKPEVFGSLVRASQACYDGAMAYQAPFVSGKDSLNNEFACEDGTTICIPATLLISAMSLVDDANKCVSMDLKQAGNVLIVVGETKNELGGSHYYKIHNELGANVPQLDLEQAPKIAAAVSETIQQGKAVSCHDCSEGGLAVALAEMAFAGGLGVDVNLDDLACSADCTDAAAKLFSESNSRYCLEVEADQVDAVLKQFKGYPVAVIGKVTDDAQVIFKAGGKIVVDADIAALKEAWQKPLKW